MEEKGIGKGDPKIRGRCNGDYEAVGALGMIISERMSQGINPAGMGKNDCAQTSGSGTVG